MTHKVDSLESSALTKDMGGGPPNKKGPRTEMHQGLYHERLLPLDDKGNAHASEREQQFAKSWIAANAQKQGVTPILEQLLNTKTSSCSQRDAVVAATVVQWLGTSVGFDFLEKTLAQAGYKIQEK